MKFSNHFRPTVSVVVALSIAAVFTLSSFAAPGRNEKLAAHANEGQSVFSGTVSGSGTIMINGNAAEPGTTVLSGSNVSTGPDGNATIQLGQLGRLTLAPNTSISLILSGSRIDLALNCPGSIAQSLPAGVSTTVKMQGQSARFVVMRGRISMNAADGAHLLNPGENAFVSSVSEVASSGEALFSITCGNDLAQEGEGPKKTGGYSAAGPGGVVVLAGVAGGIALAVLAGSNSRSATPKASTVVP